MFTLAEISAKSIGWKLVVKKMGLNGGMINLAGKESGMSLTNRECFECAEGEHQNYDANVRLFKIYDPDTNKVIRSCFLCGQHQTTRLEDGYKLYDCWSQCFIEDFI
jgi:hypothetical protein